MRAPIVAALLVLISSAVAPAAGAQGAERVPDLSRRPYVAGVLTPGARVRATVVRPTRAASPTRERFTGRLIRLDPDTLLVEADDMLVAVPRSALSRLEMPEAPTSLARGAWRGARRGLVIGVIGGAILGYVTWEDCTGEFVCLSRTDQAMASGIVAGALGFVVGGAIGAANRRERWRPVRVDADTRVGMIFTPRGAGLALRF